MDKFWGKRNLLIISASFLILSIFGIPANSIPAITAVPAVSTPTQMLNKLSVKAEVSTGYKDSYFPFNRDNKKSCDTRTKVYIEESLVKVKFKNQDACSIASGKWKSPYDGIVTTNLKSLSIDHFVARKEAWESGAYRWNASTRTAFANDLSFAGSLIAVTRSSNSSKGARDPQNWMPKEKKYHCVYVANWIAVKYRWSLSVDSAEKSFLSTQLKKCGKAAKSPVPSKAKIVMGNSSNPTTPPTSGGGGLDPRYSTCSEAKAAGFGPYVSGVDPEYAWYRDGDNDGTVCE